LSINHKKRPTLKTIASMAGLGVTTVSKALQDAPDIKVSTRQRVKLIAEQIGYQPNRAGLRLRTGKTNVISLSLSAQEEVTSMTPQFIVGIMQALRNTQYNLVLSPYIDDEDPMETIRQIVETRAADGIILSRIESNDRRLAYLDKAGLPYATHGRSDMGIDHAFFDFDSAKFGKNALQLLAKLGCRRVGLLSGSTDYAFGKFMQHGYSAGLHETGVQDCPILSTTISDSLENIADCVCRLVQKKDNRPDGFVCGSVGSAIGAIGGVESAGLVVGRDINIVAKQHPNDLLKWFGRPVYVIEDDFKAAGFGVASSLIKIIDGAPVKDHQTVVYPDNWGHLVTDSLVLP